MTEPADSEATILVVDDEKDLADLYAAWLEDDYDVWTAYRGEEALEKYDDTVDVVLLDRRMPDLSGDEVLDTLRERGDDVQVVMVTAVDPDFDILELGFDAYVTKPVDRAELHDVVERMLSRRDYDQQLQQYYRLASQRATLVAEKSEAELESNEEFEQLEARISELEGELDESVGSFGESDFEAAFRELEDT